ncbi:hypothetical protein BZA70DRAFT_123788 [Myxozyma melibiosi]|uniref:F-box domain-containing protein n=1 Tax=Myxozyma melibiosi TaxID=54550 RepID=A0ABR1FAD0_9ASCO
MTVASNSCPLLQLPTELLAHILKKVDGQSLIAVSETCHLLHALLKLRDDIWRDAAVEPLVRPSSSSLEKSSPSTITDDDSRSLCAPYTSHRELYLKLLPFTWFTPGIWHGNRDLHGSVYVSRYNRSTGHLEAYELYCGYDRQSAASFTANLAAIASTLAQTEWSVNPAVLIQNFNPSLQLSVTPVLKFTPTTTYDKQFEIEQPRSPRGMTTSFFHAARLSPDRVFYSQMSVWPPQRIPAPERTRNESPTGFRGQVVVNNIINKYTNSSSSSSSSSGSKGAVCCEHIFRLRRWISFVHADAYGVIMGERVETVARLQPELYTPDAEHSLRGLWVGDYDSHGGEFILFHQDESDKNRLEAIKLTGDANVPRGEVTFVVDDLSHVERVATEPEWPGARIVAARGHTAMLNFVNGTFSPTQLIIVNENLVAHYWINLYRIMMYRRVNVDDLLAGGSGLV